MEHEKMKALFVSLIYDELTDEETKWSEEHLANCKECAVEYKELLETSTALGRWKSEKVDMELVFIQDKISFWERLMRRLEGQGIGAKQLAFGSISIAVALLLFTGLMRTEASYRDGVWNIAYGSEETRMEEIKDSEMLREFKTMLDANLRTTNQMLLANDQRLRNESMLTLRSFAGQLENQRRQDLMLIGKSISELQQRNEGRLVRTNEMLDEIYRLASYRTGSLNGSTSIEGK